MKNLFYIASLFFSVALFTSCQKVIDVDLNSAAPKIVIEADIRNDYGCRVVLTRSVNFDEKNSFPPVSGAVVRLTDDAGNSEILVEDDLLKGFYLSQQMAGVAGRTYTLQVTVDGETYTATEKMAPPVPIDSVNLKKGLFRETKNVHAYFTDPVGVENWYQIVRDVNGIRQFNLDITEDLLRDGQQIEATLFVNGEDSLVVGDTVNVYLRNIDEGSFNYFRTVFQAEGGGDPGATPANPISNFTNGALGYFSVYSETEKKLVVE